MAAKAVCVLKSDKVNGVVNFVQEVITKKLSPSRQVMQYIFELKYAN